MMWPVIVRDKNPALTGRAAPGLLPVRRTMDMDGYMYSSHQTIVR